MIAYAFFFFLSNAKLLGSSFIGFSTELSIMTENTEKSQEMGRLCLFEKLISISIFSHLTFFLSETTININKFDILLISNF